MRLAGIEIAQGHHEKIVGAEPELGPQRFTASRFGGDAVRDHTERAGWESQDARRVIACVARNGDGCRMAHGPPERNPSSPGAGKVEVAMHRHHVWPARDPAGHRTEYRWGEFMGMHGVDAVASQQPDDVAHRARIEHPASRQERPLDAERIELLPEPALAMSIGRAKDDHRVAAAPQFQRNLNDETLGTTGIVGLDDLGHYHRITRAEMSLAAGEGSPASVRVCPPLWTAGWA